MGRGGAARRVVATNAPAAGPRNKPLIRCSNKLAAAALAVVLHFEERSLRRLYKHFESAWWTQLQPRVWAYRELPMRSVKTLWNVDPSSPRRQDGLLGRINHDIVIACSELFFCLVKRVLHQFVERWTLTFHVALNADIIKDPLAFANCSLDRLQLRLFF